MDTFSKFAGLTYKARYAHGEETWTQVAWRTATATFSKVSAHTSLVEAAAKAIEARKFMPGGRYLFACGRPIHQTNNCCLFRAEDSREGWASLYKKVSLSLMTGAGIGVVYSDVRGKGQPIKSIGGLAAGPLSPMQILNEIGRGTIQGGSLRSALWAGLSWAHPNIMDFIKMKNWSEEIRALKAKDFNFKADMDMTNISVILNQRFFDAYHDRNHPDHIHAGVVYWATIKQMLKTSEPGFSVDVGENEGEDLRNACCEITSRDDSDVCNLASINMSRVKDTREMERLCRIAAAFCVAGSVYSDLPCEEVRTVREKNRRIGIGLMGLHEWLLQRGKSYGPDDELEEYLEIYKDTTDDAAEEWAKEWKLSVPVKKRAIAPTGTIAIVAGPTTTGIEPMLCASYLRRYLKGKTRYEQYVIEPIAQRLIDQGAKPEELEDAYSISVERRLEFQSWVQAYVDHGISSTINLPSWGSDKNNKQTVQEYGELFLKYLPRLRGVTCYADGSRHGQPIVPVPYKKAKEMLAIEETLDICTLSGKGVCGE